MSEKYSPIGVFDSGYGGLTVLTELLAVLPDYDYLYLGDNARAPYGTRSFDVVYEYTWECIKELFARGCELVIVACNTASAKALRTIQQGELKKYPGKRVLGVIRPSAEKVGELTKSRVVGVLATEGTVKSNSYVLEISNFSPDIEVVQQACPLWVPLIENNAFNSKEGRKFIEKDIKVFLEKHPNLDIIILGCTHYPLLIPLLLDLIPASIQLISQGDIVAHSLKNYLDRHVWMETKLSRRGSVRYLTSENPLIFNESVLNILGQNIAAEYIHINHTL